MTSKRETASKEKRGMSIKEWEKHLKGLIMEHINDARKALVAHKDKKPGESIVREDIVDLLADLRHFAHRHDFDYDAADRNAFNHFYAETHGEE